MSGLKRSVALLLVQAALALSVAGKYVYERKVCPRVWVRTAQFDPNMPLRGRYMALQLSVDACNLPMDDEHHTGPIEGSNPPDLGYWRWRIKPVVRDGKLVAEVAGDDVRPELTDEVTVRPGRTCSRATLTQPVDYFIPDTAKTPWPMRPGEELWVEVTVPPMGPPRPIQLAVSKDGAFTPLKL